MQKSFTHTPQKIIQYCLVIFCSLYFVACNQSDGADKFEKKSSSETTKTLDTLSETVTRLFTGSTSQYGRELQELLVLNIDGQNISGRSYNAGYDIEPPLIDSTKAFENYPVKGFVDEQGRFRMQINYGEGNNANMMGILDNAQILKGIASGRGISPITDKPEKFQDQVFEYDELVNGRLGDPQKVVIGMYANYNKYGNFRAMLGYPRLHHADYETMSDYNRQVLEYMEETFQRYMEANSGDEGAAFYQKRGVTEMQNLSMLIVNFTEEYVSVMDTLLIKAPDEPVPSVGLYAFNYDFSLAKQMELKDLFKPDADYLPVLQKAALSEIERQVKRSYKSDIVANVKNGLFDYWTFDEHFLHLYYIVIPTPTPNYQFATQKIIIPLAALKSVTKF